MRVGIEVRTGILCALTFAAMYMAQAKLDSISIDIHDISASSARAIATQKP